VPAGDSTAREPIGMKGSALTVGVTAEVDVMTAVAVTAADAASLDAAGVLAFATGGAFVGLTGRWVDAGVDVSVGNGVLVAVGSSVADGVFVGSASRTTGVIGVAVGVIVGDGVAVGGTGVAVSVAVGDAVGVGVETS
jgi:hypothetical protein